MNDQVVVVFDKLEQAISEYRTCSGAISELASRLNSNASNLQSCWSGAASDTYAGKMATLKQNVDKASEKLSSSISTDLENRLDLHKQAEQKAQSTSEGISELTLE